jgi:hypothetical protein
LAQPPTEEPDIYPCLEHYISSTSLSIVYGQPSQFGTSVDPIVITLNKSIERILNSLVDPHPVEILPWLDYIPSRYVAKPIPELDEWLVYLLNSFSG